MNVELLTDHSSPNPDQIAAFAARTCYSPNSPVEMDFEDAIEDVSTDTDADATREEKHEKLLRQLIRRGHFSVFEHPKAAIAVEGVSRACMAQLTRHRHLSFSVQSQRYVNFEDADVYTPESATETEATAERYREAIEAAFDHYHELVDAGVPEEDARHVLPIGTKVNMVVSGNARAWMHVVDMRVAGDAQGEIRELGSLILEELHEWAPKTFELYENYARGSSKKAP